MAAKCAGISFEVFLTWCSEADNFGGEGDCRAAWRSFDVNGGITAASLFDAALKAGWKAPTLAANGVAYKTITKAVIRAQTPVVTVESTRATEVWELCVPAPRDHQYLLRKCGVPDGLRSYDNLQCSREFGRLNSEPTEYIDGQSKICRMVKMTKDGFVMLVMGFAGEAATVFKDSGH
jgi:Rha family phage regulatory protein